MFTVVAGRRKRRIWSPTTIAASVAVHVLLVGGAVYGATSAPAPREGVDIVDLPPLPTEPKPRQPQRQPPPPAPANPSAPVPTPGATLAVQTPTTVPVDIPPVDPTATPIDPSQVTGIGPVGDVIGPPPEDPTPLTGNTTPAPPRGHHSH